VRSVTGGTSSGDAGAEVGDEDVGEARSRELVDPRKKYVASFESALTFLPTRCLPS
jgi:hypothetical protein